MLSLSHVPLQHPSIHPHCQSTLSLCTLSLSLSLSPTITLHCDSTLTRYCQSLPSSRLHCVEPRTIPLYLLWTLTLCCPSTLCLYIITVVIWFEPPSSSFLRKGLIRPTSLGCHSVTLSLSTVTFYYHSILSLFDVPLHRRFTLSLCTYCCDALSPYAGGAFSAAHAHCNCLGVWPY